MFTYQQSTGELRDDNGALLTVGYSGHGKGLNNPAMENCHNVGPIPQGFYKIMRPAFDHTEHGPCVMHLLPMEGTNTFGRDGFLMHGDSKEHAGEHLASLGCVVVAAAIRNLVAHTTDDLHVIA